MFFWIACASLKMDWLWSSSEHDLLSTFNAPWPSRNFHTLELEAVFRTCVGRVNLKDVILYIFELSPLPLKIVTSCALPSFSYNKALKKEGIPRHQMNRDPGTSMCKVC